MRTYLRFTGRRTIDHHYQSAFSAYAGPGEENIFLGFNAAFVGPEQDPRILQDIERGNFTIVYLSPESVL